MKYFQADIQKFRHAMMHVAPTSESTIWRKIFISCGV